MKKLLTVLLTLVMAVCLVNLNYGHTKADDTSSNETLEGQLYTNSGDGHLHGTISGASVDLDDGSHEANKTALGIQHDYTNHILTLSKDLSLSANNDLLVVQSNEKIVLSNSIKLTKSGSGSTITLNVTNLNVEINGGNNINTLTINPTVQNYTGIIGVSSTLALNKTNLVIEGDFTGSSLLIKNLNIDEYSSVVLKNTNTSKGALESEGTLTMPSTYEILGSESSTPTEADLKVPVKDTDNVYKVSDAGGNLQVAKYIVIRKKKQPTPSPEPQPKDESCEKVIGPTWHWNNDKGICEEYATVGTSTR